MVATHNLHERIFIKFDWQVYTTNELFEFIWAVELLKLRKMGCGSFPHLCKQWKQKRLIFSTHDLCFSSLSTFKHPWNLSPCTSHISLGISLPEGVDPSFLAALPDDIRREVLQNQLGIRPPTRSAPSTNSSAPAVVGNPGVTEVSPEFLAALPPAIQEEVCEQEHGENRLSLKRPILYWFIFFYRC